MMYKYLLQEVFSKGKLIERELPIISLYNYHLNLQDYDLEDLLKEIPIERKEKFEKEFNLFMNGVDDVNVYNNNGIKYWNYIGDKFINSYPQYYSKFNSKNIKEHSKNNILYLGSNEYSNQKPCMSLIQFQIINKELYLSVFQRSCDLNLGFLADLYHLKLFANKTNYPLKEIGILYGNLHIYKNNIVESKRYIDENGKFPPYKFIQNNLRR